MKTYSTLSELKDAVAKSEVEKFTLSLHRVSSIPFALTLTNGQKKQMLRYLSNYNTLPCKVYKLDGRPEALFAFGA